MVFGFSVSAVKMQLLPAPVWHLGAPWTQELQLSLFTLLCGAADSKLPGLSKVLWTGKHSHVS